jgi:hypothetical protein
MKRITVLLLTSILWFTTDGKAQELDLSLDKVVLTCASHRMSGETLEYVDEQPLHAEEMEIKNNEVIIEIDTKAKKILIFKSVDKTVLYDLTYYMSHKGEGHQSISLKPWETMFMTSDEKVVLLTHDQNSRVLFVVWKDNQNEVFEELSLKTEE